MMGTMDNVRAHLAPEAGETSRGYVSPTDIGDAIQEVYDDHEPRIAAVEGGTGIDDGSIVPAKLDRAYVIDGKLYVRAGQDAGLLATDETRFVAVGYRAMRDEVGDSAVAIGYETQMAASGSHATAVGHKVQRLASGTYATAVGVEAQENASGGWSVAVGGKAQNAASGVESVAVGWAAQFSSSGYRSVAVGTKAQCSVLLVNGGTSYAGPLIDGGAYRIIGTNLAVDGVPLETGPFGVAQYTGTGEESLVTGDSLTIWYDAEVDIDYHTAIGSFAFAEHVGGIALGYNAYADTDRQVQIGTAVTVNGVEPPNALRVGVHDAILTTDTPTTGEVLRFDGSAWVADGAATAAQGALADSAVQPGDLATVATTGAYGDLSGTPTLGTAAGQNVEAFATSAQGVKADAAAPAATLGNQVTQAEWDGTGGWPVAVGGTVAFSGGAATFTSDGSAPSAPRIVSTQIASSAGQLWTAITTIANPSSVPVQLRLLGATLVTQIAEVDPGETREVMVTGVLPASSTFVHIYVVAPNLPSGESFSVSAPALHRGAGGIAIRPGVSVPNTGIRDKPTNVAVTQVYNRSTSSWLDAGVSGSGVTFGTTAGTATEGNDSRVVNAVQTSRQVATGSGLTGGGDLTANRTLAVDFTAVATAAQGVAAEKVEIGVACSDETTDLATGTAKVTFRLPHAMTLTGVRASVTTAPVGSALTVDINAGGASVLSTLLTIDAGEKTSTTAATPAVIGTSALADDAEITVDIDAVGSLTAGAGLKVWLIGTRA